MPDTTLAARSATSLVLLVLALACADAGAQALYKLVDRNGKVTYSDSVPKDFKGRVIPLHIDPNLNSSESSPAQGQDGEGRGETPAEGNNRRRPTTDDDPIAAARQKAQAARKAFEDVRDNSTPDDWIYVKPDRNPRSVRRYPKPEYAARLVELERLAVVAEQELDKLERARRIYP
jgi:hypothetical protein